MQNPQEPPTNMLRLLARTKYFVQCTSCHREFKYIGRSPNHPGAAIESEIKL